MKLSVGDKVLMNAQEWTVVSGTVSGKKVWIARLTQVLGETGTEWKYIDHQLVDIDAELARV